MQSTDTKTPRQRSRAHQPLLLINANAYECSPNKDQTLAPQLLTLNVYFPATDPFNYSQAIKLKGLSGTLSITWTPGEFPASSPPVTRRKSKSSTSDT